jgi:dephospho-CoA kinase
VRVIRKNHKICWVALTGGIGAGKSVVTDYLIQQSCFVLDTDVISRTVVSPGSTTLKSLVNCFGTEILSSDGELDRTRLASLAFSNEESKKKLDSIMHAAIITELTSQMAIYESASRKECLAFVAVPLVFEAKMEALFDAVWSISSNKELRIKRVMERENCDRSAVLDRMQWQTSDSERNARSDAVLSNNGNKDELFKQIDELLETHTVSRETRKEGSKK